MVVDSSCNICQHPRHSLLHVLRDCPSASGVRKQILTEAQWSALTRPEDIVTWVKTNLYTRQRCRSFGSFWTYIFSQFV